MAAEYRAKNPSSDDSEDILNIKNGTGKDINIYVGGTKNMDKFYHSSSINFNCNEDVTYVFNPNSRGYGVIIYI